MHTAIEAPEVDWLRRLLGTGEKEERVRHTEALEVRTAEVLAEHQSVERERREALDDWHRVQQLQVDVDLIRRRAPSRVRR